MKQYSTLTHRYEDVAEMTDGRTNAIVPTVDLTTPEDGTLRRYRVRELRKGGSSEVVEATSKSQAKDKARERYVLVGKLSAEVM